MNWGYDAIDDAIDDVLERDAAVLNFEVLAARECTELAGKELYQGAKKGRESWAFSRKRDGEERTGGLVRLGGSSGRGRCGSSGA